MKRLASATPTKAEIDTALNETSAFLERFKTGQEMPISERKSIIRQLVDKIEVDRGRRVAQCYILAMPKSAGKFVEEMVENCRTHLMNVPPTGFEPMLQA